MPEGFFGQARPFLAGILPYGKENERSLPEKAPGRSCSMVVHTGSKAFMTKKPSDIPAVFAFQPIPCKRSFKTGKPVL